MALQRLHSTTSVAGSSSSSSRSRRRTIKWRTLKKLAMSRSSSESSLSSTMLKESDDEDLRKESQAVQQRSLTRSPRSPLSGNTKSRLPHENTKRKQAISGTGSPPRISPRKVSRPELEKVPSSRAPSHSTSVATLVVASPRRSFWNTSYRQEAASDSLARNVQHGRKSAPEEKSADGSSIVKQGQANTSSQPSTRSQQGLASGSSHHRNATSGRERTLASTSSGRMTLKEKSAVEFSAIRQGHKSSTLRSPSKCKQGLASGSSHHRNATSGRERTLASTTSGRMTLKEKSAVEFSAIRQGHKSSTLRSPSKRKQGLASGSSHHRNATSGRERTLASTSSGRMTLKEKSAVEFSAIRLHQKKL
ncbi:serine-rich adhesin for platelets-like isoform X2 [Dermacentor albipictus]|uniref:serine-rich adhesin for platelets-like isoform X2 n=1 Tax=Dermacentor albipictus TaxID=60249 RepID=UPI0031FC836D